MEFQNLVKNEFNLFFSLNSCQKIVANNTNRSIYSFKKFTYEKNMLFKSKMFNKKDVFNKYILLTNLLSSQQKQIEFDNSSKKCFNDENFVLFLSKSEKIKKFLQFYEQEYNHHNKSLLEKINNSLRNTQEFLENVKDFKSDLESLKRVNDILDEMPDGLKQIINLWKKSNK